MYYFFQLLMGCLLAVSPVFANTGETINVFVSILPQKYLVERIGGDRVAVSVMVRPGLSPETYEPTPKQMAALNDAHLYFRIATPFESIWIKRIQSINPRLDIVGCCGELEISDPVHQHHNGFNTSTANDAHVWTSPKNAVVLAGIIKSGLTKHDPEFSDYYYENYTDLIDDLNALDSFIRKELAGIKNPYFIVSHPSWGHYAETYDLEQISIEQHGTEIRARELTRLIEFARQHNIKNIYVQRQFNSASARVLAREIGGKLIELDPLAENYIENLREVTRAIAAGAIQ